MSETETPKSNNSKGGINKITLKSNGQTLVLDSPGQIVEIIMEGSGDGNKKKLVK